MELREILRSAIESDSLVSLVLSKPCAAGQDAGEKITVRPIVLKGKTVFQWAKRRGNQEFHENLPAAGTIEAVTSLFGSRFRDCHIHANDADYSARATRKGKVKISQSKKQAEISPTKGSHNRVKNYLIPEHEPCRFLEEIGVMTSSGQVKAKRYKKFRQINRYLDIVNDIVPDLPASGVLQLVDFGCGKSYLTFALHHLLTTVHAREVRIIGLDQKADVIRDCQAIAERLGCQGLEFRQGDLWSHEEEQVHLAVSLHACDTATDDALAKAVSWNSDVILAVPCCQHELARKLPGDFLRDVQSHGILKDRLAAMLTDSLRAKALETVGYKSLIVEFIDLEHTPKNVLIRATRRSNNAKTIQEALSQYHEFKKGIGIEEFRLDRALDELKLGRIPEDI